MGSSLFRFRGRGKWVSNGLAEFWYRILLCRPAFKNCREEWLANFVKEVNNAIETGWMDGIIMTAFDKYLTDEIRIEFIQKEILELNGKLRDMAHTNDIVSCGNDQATSTYLLDFIDMVDDFFINPEKVPIIRRVHECD